MLDIARRSAVLMPADPQGRARTEAWAFAALNSIEPFVMAVVEIDVFCRGEAWATERRPAAVERMEKPVCLLEDWLGDRDYLEGTWRRSRLYDLPPAYSGPILKTAILLPSGSRK